MSLLASRGWARLGLWVLTLGCLLGSARGSGAHAEAYAGIGAGSYDRALALASEERLEEARLEALTIEEPLLRAQALVYVHFLASDYAGALPVVTRALEQLPDSADFGALAWLAERGASAAIYCEDTAAARAHLGALELQLAKLPAEARSAWVQTTAELESRVAELESRRVARTRAVTRARRFAIGVLLLCGFLLCAGLRP